MGYREVGSGGVTKRVEGFPDAMSQNAVATLFGVSRSTVGRWLRDGCPRSKDGTLDARAVIKWRGEKMYRDGVRAGGEEAQEEGVDPKDAGDKRWKAARAELKELELAEAKKLFANVDEVEEKWARALGTFSQSLQGLPAQLAPKLAGKSIDEIFRKLETALRRAVDGMKKAYSSADEE